MRISSKYLPILLLGTALSGCSMAGTGDYFADEYAQLQQQQMPHLYGAQKNTNGSDCSTVEYTQSSCGPAYSAQAQNWAHASTPDAHAYGRSVQGHTNYVPSAYGAAAHGLRGSTGGFTPHAYGTLGVTNYEVGEDLYGAQARAGYQFSKYFGAEVEGSLGLSKGTKTVTAAGLTNEQTLGIDNSIAGFGVVRYPLFDKVSGYSRVGYHRSELDEKVSDATSVLIDREYSVDGLAYGSGLEYSLNPRTAIRLDYTVYDYDGPDADSVSLAISRKF